MPALRLPLIGLMALIILVWTQVRSGEMSIGSAVSMFAVYFGVLGVSAFAMKQRRTSIERPKDQSQDEETPTPRR
jgi:hypothetical protein